MLVDRPWGWSRLGTSLLPLVALSIGMPGVGLAASPDRLVALMQNARGSSCFLAPTRPASLEATPSGVVGAAFQGEASAMYRVAEAYMADDAGGVSGRQALPWLERAATAGHAGAAADLGRVYAAGRGTAPDPRLAAGWWLFGATRGDARAMACASVSYVLGFGVPVDVVEAARWAILRDAASGGRTLLGPTTADFERALPATEMLAARKRATEMLEPVRPPAMMGNVSPADPERHAQAQAQGNPAANGVGLMQPASLPRLPPPVPSGLAGYEGSGTVIAAPGLVLTAAHVVRGCSVLIVRAGTAEFGGSELLATNQELDLALLTVPGLSRRPIPVASSTRLGTEIVVLGFPDRGVRSERLTATLGNVSTIGTGAGSDLIQFTAPIQPGNSGGPLINRQGQVVGVAIARNELRQELVAGLRPSQNVNFAAAPTTVFQFLTDHGVNLEQGLSAGLDITQLVEQVERSVVRIRCHRSAPPQSSAPAKPLPAPVTASDPR